MCGQVMKKCLLVWGCKLRKSNLSFVTFYVIVQIVNKERELIMIIKLDISDEVINDFCEEFDVSKEEVVDGIKDWFSYYNDKEFFKEELKVKIMNY